MKKAKTIKELRSEFRQIKDCAADTDWFIAKAMMFLCENLRGGGLRIKRKPSAWNSFVGKYLSEGKTIKDAATDWKKLKEKRKNEEKEKTKKRFHLSRLR